MFSCCAGYMILTTLLQNNSYYRLTAVIELESTSDILEETTYLDTQSMNIMYSPPYLPDDDIAKNYTSKSFYGTRPGIYVTLKLTSPHHNKCVHRGAITIYEDGHYFLYDYVHAILYVL